MKLLGTFGCSAFPILLLAGSPASDGGQAPSVAWTKTFGGAGSDGATCVRPTRDGGYVAVGWTESFSHGKSDVFLLKLDAEGYLLWQNHFGGRGRDIGYHVAEVNRRIIVVVGETNSFRDPKGAPSTPFQGDPWASTPPDIYLIKVNQITGDLLWEHHIGKAFSEIGYSIAAPRPSEYVVFGKRTTSPNISFGHDTTDLFLMKVKEMNRGKIRIAWDCPLGGKWESEDCFSMQPTGDGGYLVAGSTRSFGVGRRDAYFAKIADEGEKARIDAAWVEGADNGIDDDGLLGIDDGSGKCVLVRRTEGGLVFSTRAISGVKSPSKDEASTRSLSLSVKEIVACTKSHEGGFLIAGHRGPRDKAGREAHLIRVNPGFHIDYEVRIGDLKWARCAWADEDFDGNIIVAGTSVSNGANGEDLCVVKLVEAGKGNGSKAAGKRNRKAR